MAIIRWPIVVNIYGGPGSGKSTFAAELFAKLKKEGINCELITEFAKDITWEHNTKALATQAYVFGNQYYRMARVADEVDVIITDSPLLQSLIHDKDKRTQNALGESMLVPLVEAADKSFINVNVFMEQPYEYCETGRNESAEEALMLSEQIRDMLDSRKMNYFECKDETTRTDILDTITRIVTF